ncbi:MAG: hypothetical protein RR115_00925 [Hydrogenoanaerobacterium sp.]
MEDEYSLFIPENIKIKKDLFGDISKKDFIKALWVSAIGGVPIGLSYFITHLDALTTISVLLWIFLVYSGYVKFLFDGRRSCFGQIKIMLNWSRAQKHFSYYYKPEWRLYT